MARRRSTVGRTAAAALLGISPELLHFRATRAKVNKIRAVRHHPLRFRLIDVLEARERMSVKDKRGSWPRPPHLTHAIKEIQEALV